MINISIFHIAIFRAVTPVVLQEGISILEEYTAYILRVEVLRTRNQ
jgi:hypothetical protein